MNPNDIILNELPPLEWFQTLPADIQVGKIDVTDEGRVFGKIADSGIRYVGSKQKVELDESNFLYAHQGYADTADGVRVKVGVIAADLEHAPFTMSPRAQAEWNAGNMADTARQLVQVVYKNSDDGTILVLGSVIPYKTTYKEILDIRRTPISGHWRQIWDDRNDKPIVGLMGAIFVNQPGYRIDLSQIAASVDDLDENIFYSENSSLAMQQKNDDNIISDLNHSKNEDTIAMDLTGIESRLDELKQLVAAAPADGTPVDATSTDLTIVNEKLDAIASMLVDISDAIGTLAYDG